MSCGHTKLYMDDVIRGPQQYPSCLICQVHSLETSLDCASRALATTVQDKRDAESKLETEQKAFAAQQEVLWGREADLTKLEDRLNGFVAEFNLRADLVATLESRLDEALADAANWKAECRMDKEYRGELESRLDALRKYVETQRQAPHNSNERKLAYQLVLDNMDYGGAVENQMPFLTREDIENAALKPLSLKETLGE